MAPVRCVVVDSDQAPIVKSDLHFAILKRLRPAGIRMASPQREVGLLGETAAPVPAKPAEA
jgi:small-conductance mechanosensitive channel